MSSFSTKLLLKRNDGSDPFLRQDFVDNWNKLDAAPGAYICDSTTRPTWTSAQSGRAIYETDTQRTVWWSGTAWLEPLSAPVVYNVNSAPNSSVAHGATATFTLGTVTLKRICQLTVIYEVILGNLDSVAQSATLTPWIDNASALLGQQGIYDWDGGNNNGLGTNYVSVGCLGSLANASVGAHTIGMRLVVGTSSTGTTPVIFNRCTAAVFVTAPAGS